jgi:hypothetical protein
VKQALLDITNGVAAARLDTPTWIAPGTYEAGGTISVWAAASAKGSAASEQVNRISFEVPVFFQSRKPRPSSVLLK